MTTRTNHDSGHLYIIDGAKVPDGITICQIAFQARLIDRAGPTVKVWTGSDWHDLCHARLVGPDPAGMGQL